ncbi:MAG: LAGLIDADG family homing endonuclease [Candidatus Aenigmatarchaeota archaeon]
MEILKKVEISLPKEVVSRIELEGSEIIVYTKDREFFRTSEETVRQIVSEIKKRIEVRLEKDLCLEEEVVKEKIKEIVPSEANIKDIYFEPERSLVIIAAEKPGLVIGKGGETFRKIKAETLWTPRIERVPPIKSDVINGIRKVLHAESKFRKKFLNEIGEKIFGERSASRDWIRVIALGGFREVGRSCLLVETPKSKVLVDCGIAVGASNANQYPILNTKEFDYNELDAIIISHAHLDHCLHPESYVQLPNGEICRIEDYYNSLENGIVSVDIDESLKIEPIKCAEKVRIESPRYLYRIATKSKKIKVTGNHPFFSFDGEKIIVKNASELKVGDFVATVKKIDFEGKSQNLPKIIRTVIITEEGRKLLKNTRIKKGLKQREVAKFLGVSQETISILERDKNHLWDLNFIQKLASFYGINNFIENFTKIKFNKSTKITLPDKTSEEFCQILGYLLGDGDRTDIRVNKKRYVTIRLTDKDIRNLKIYQSLIKKVFKLNGKIKEGERKRLFLYSPLLLDFLNSISKEILCKSPNRKIPPLLHTVSKKELASFLRGLFDAEGSVGHHQIKLTTTSYDIAQVTQILLLRFGIISHIYESKESRGQRNIYQLSISDPTSIIKFYKYINFGSPTKSDKLREFVLFSNFGGGIDRMNLIPISGKLIIKIAKKLGISKGELKKLKINYFHYLQGHALSIKKAKEMIKFFKNISRNKGMIVKELNQLEKLINSDVLWEQVEKIEIIPSDTKYVYDLKIPGHHNYVANGIIVHNCGFVPALVERGYDGPIYMTTPTVDLATLLWLDYIDVMQKSMSTPFFTAKGVKEAVKHTIPLEFGEVSDVAPDIRLTFQNAGHILGSALVHLHIGEGLHNIVYALDQKFGRTTLLEPAFTNFQRVETLIIESTYGGEKDIMPSRQETEKQLLSVINSTMEKRGICLIPSFSVERAQEVMAILVENNFQYPVFLDGMIWDANGIFTAYPEYLSRSMQKKIFSGEDPFLNPIFKRIASPSEREKAWEEKPCVIISTSGMLIGGPVMEHLKALAENPNNTLVFVGYQSEGTLGRRIQKGWREIPMKTEDGKNISIEMKMGVETIEGLSGHSDRSQLLAFVHKLASKPDRVIVAHGESQKALELARTVHRTLRVETNVPRNLESLRLK